MTVGAVCVMRTSMMTALACLLSVLTVSTRLPAQTMRERFPSDTSKPARMQKPVMVTIDTGKPARLGKPRKPSLDTVFVAKGSNPSWALTVRRDSLILSMAPKGSTLRFNAVKSDTMSGVVSWHLNSGGHALLIKARLGRCIPDPPDDAWGHYVTIRLDGKTLKGCGGRKSGGS